MGWSFFEELGPRVSRLDTPRLGSRSADVAARLVERWGAEHPFQYFALRSLLWLCRHPGIIAGACLSAYVYVYTHSAWAFACMCMPIVVINLWRLAASARSLGGRSAPLAVILPGIVKFLPRYWLLARRWTDAAIAGGFASSNARTRKVGSPPPLRRVRVERDGLSVTARPGRVGRTVEDLLTGSYAAAGAIGCSTMDVAPGRHPGIARVFFRWGNPLRKVIPLDKLPPPTARGRIVIGITDRHEPAELRLTNGKDDGTSILMVGETGSGKSTTAWAVLAAIIMLGIPVRLRVIDPAGGVELAELGTLCEKVWAVKDLRGGYRPVGRASIYDMHGRPPKGVPHDALQFCKPCNAGRYPLFHVHDYVDNARYAAGVIDGMRAALDKRLKYMRGRKHFATWKDPHDLLLIDEMLLTHHLLREGPAGNLGTILSVGRKACFTVLGLAQLSQKDIIGGNRDLFRQRVSHALGSMGMVAAVFGPQAIRENIRPDRIGIDEPGVGYIYSSESREYRRFRAAHITDQDIRALMMRLREPPPPMDGAVDLRKVI